MDIELNGAAWGALMGQKAKVLPGMTFVLFLYLKLSNLFEPF